MTSLQSTPFLTCASGDFPAIKGRKTPGSIILTSKQEHSKQQCRCRGNATGNWFCSPGSPRVFSLCVPCVRLLCVLTPCSAGDVQSPQLCCYQQTA
uniref:Uncharacterized protein n=1 Tax=Ficedula albicollis TaxID=59894 RepID=A0A803VG78_FICAL